MPDRPTAALAPPCALRRLRGAGWFRLALILIVMSACSRSVKRAGTPAANLAGAASTSTVSHGPNADAATGERLGAVHVIGTDRRFVLIETPAVQPVAALADGQALVCRAAGAVTATLKVSHERRPPFVVADVTGGEPHLGDEVFIDAALGHTTLPTLQAPTTPASPGQVPAATPDFRADPALPPAR